MKAIVNIGHTQILLPDVATASKVVQLLEKGLPCWNHTYRGNVELREEPLELSMAVVPDGTLFVRKRESDGAEEPVSETPAQSQPKRLTAGRGRNQLRLLG